MSRIHIETDKTHGEPFDGFKTIYVVPAITITYYKNLRETSELYVELTWIVFIVRVIIDLR